MIRIQEFATRRIQSAKLPRPHAQTFSLYVPYVGSYLFHLALHVPPGGRKGKNLEMLSRALVGRVVNYIWACCTCYNIFLFEMDLKVHRQVVGVTSVG